MAGTFSSKSLTFQENFFQDSKEILPQRFFQFLLSKISHFPAINLDEIRLLLGELADYSQVPQGSDQRRVSSAVELDVKTTSAYDKNKQMTKVDRLLELLWMPEVYPVVINLLKELQNEIKKTDDDLKTSEKNLDSLKIF